MNRSIDIGSVISRTFSIYADQASVLLPPLADGLRLKRGLPFSIPLFLDRLEDHMSALSIVGRGDAVVAREVALRGALGHLEREFGKGTLMRMGDPGAQVRCEAIPTGALSLDLALGIGGVPPTSWKGGWAIRWLVGRRG